jgi:HEPN domain-containing protein
MAMANVQPFDRAQTVEDHLAKARHAADIGDGPHTVLHAQQAVCMAVAALGEDIAALRSALANRGG